MRTVAAALCLLFVASAANSQQAVGPRTFSLAQKKQMLYTACARNQSQPDSNFCTCWADEMAKVPLSQQELLILWENGYLLPSTRQAQHTADIWCENALPRWPTNSTR
jgi:hypothetical protein